MSYWDSLPRPGWENEARCAGMDRDLFFRQQPYIAKETCSKCWVRDDCLAFALEAEKVNVATRYGVFGGLTGDERRRLAASLPGGTLSTGGALSTEAHAS